MTLHKLHKQQQVADSHVAYSLFRQLRAGREGRVASLGDAAC